MAKQLVQKEQRCRGCSAGCVSDNDGDIVVVVDKLMDVRKEHYNKISNEEFSLDREGLTGIQCRIVPHPVGVTLHLSRNSKWMDALTCGWGSDDVIGRIGSAQEVRVEPPVPQQSSTV